MRFTTTMAQSVGFSDPGLAAIPRSIKLASSYAMHMPTLSPCFTLVTGLRNICIDLIFFSYFNAGSSITSPTFALPAKTVPVITVPYPLI